MRILQPAQPRLAMSGYAYQIFRLVWISPCGTERRPCGEYPDPSHALEDAPRALAELAARASNTNEHDRILRGTFEILPLAGFAPGGRPG